VDLDELAATVGVHINLDSGGGWGRAMVNQLGPNNAWLAAAYKRGAPYPYGSVLVQDLVCGLGWTKTLTKQTTKPNELPFFFYY